MTSHSISSAQKMTFCPIGKHISNGDDLQKSVFCPHRETPSIAKKPRKSRPYPQGFRMTPPSFFSGKQVMVDITLYTLYTYTQGSSWRIWKDCLICGRPIVLVLGLCVPPPVHTFTKSENRG